MQHRDERSGARRDGRRGRQEHVDSFLRLGYFVDYDENRYPIDYSRIDKPRYASTPREELIRLGAVILQETFDQLWTPGRDNVVPLSGGLDSRLILGALLEHTEARSLHTYTFGVPGSYDYEIGCRVAREVGTRHVALPMDAISWHRDELIEVARREDCQAVLFYNQPLRVVEALYQGAVFWSGYVGDVVAGSHCHDPPSPTLEEAKRRYLRSRRVVKSVQLWRGEDDDLLPWIAGGGLPPETMTWDEQVLFEEAGSKFVVPHVLWKGFEYQTPLINSPWMDFMFSVPDRLRHGEALMIDIARAAFPALFDLPSKNRLGHSFRTPDAVVRATFWLNRARKVAHRIVPAVNWPNAQYSDFNEEIRTRRDLREIVRGGLEGVKRRGICDWVDVDGLWNRHIRRIRNHADALVALASLDLVLEARESGGAEEGAG